MTTTARKRCATMLSGCQIHIGLRQIFGDDRRMLFQCQLNGGLAGGKTFGRKPQAAASARQAHVQICGIVAFQEQAAVSVGDGHGVIQHGAQH